jgi:hypothetical protein
MPQGTTHQQTRTNLPLPRWTAADERVTAQELSTAIRAVEQRRRESSERRTNTLTLGEAIEHLSLDATPEELLAEVEQQRRLAAVARRRGSLRPKRLPQRWLCWPAGVAVALVWFGANFVSVRQEHHRRTAHPVLATSTPRSAPSDIPVTVPGPDGRPAVVTLAEVPEGQAALVSSAALPRLMRVEPAVHEVLRSDLYWTLVRYGGRVYVRGYLDTTAARRAALIGPFSLRNESPQVDGNGRPLSPSVTLPLDAFQVRGGMLPTFQEYQELTFDALPGTGVDKHAFGK